MDERRFHELEVKRDSVGLTTDEANELGRMMAEKEERRYSNAEDRDQRAPSEKGTTEGERQPQEARERAEP